MAHEKQPHADVHNCQSAYCIITVKMFLLCTDLSQMF